MLVSAVGMLALLLPLEYVAVLLVYAGFSLAHEPVKPMADGVFFAARRRAGAPPIDCHQVRIWGTVGYLVPGVLVYVALSAGDGIGVIPMLGAAMALFGTINALRLRAGDRVPVGAGPGRGDAGPKLTTASAVRAALRILGRPAVRRLVIGMFLLQAALAAYAAFYPLHLTEVVGVETRWIGLISNIGVGLEIGCMAAFGWLRSRLGWRWLLIGGTLAHGGRLVLLAASPELAAALSAQLVHGFAIIVLMVASRVLMDEAAGDHLRYTVQGLFTMFVIGGGRLMGSALGGVIAELGLAWVFAASALACGAAAILFARAFPSRLDGRTLGGPRDGR